jgi:hypothetical protein
MKDFKAPEKEKDPSRPEGKFLENFEVYNFPRA